MTEELLVFRGSLIVTAVIRTYRPGEEKYVADLHERLYAEEYGWGPAFVTYAKEIALDFPRRPENGRECLWIAEVDGEPAGSVMLCETDDPSTGQLRLFAVEKSRRRQGIGRALMEVLLAKAQEAGVQNADPVDGGTARSGHSTVRALRLPGRGDSGKPDVASRRRAGARNQNGKDAQGLSFGLLQIDLVSRKRTAPRLFTGFGVSFGVTTSRGGVCSSGRGLGEECFRR